jgi:hypothetical protein
LSGSGLLVQQIASEFIKKKFSIGLVLRCALSVEAATHFYFWLLLTKHSFVENCAKPSDKQVPVAEPAKDEPCSTSQPSS